MVLNVIVFIVTLHGSHDSSTTALTKHMMSRVTVWFITCHMT